MNRQVGFILNASDGPDPAYLAWENAKRAESTKLWASFFSKGNPDYLRVKVPQQWAQFFTFLHLSPTNYSWAKEFLSSRVSSFLAPNSPNINFFLPPACPSDIPPVLTHINRMVLQVSNPSNSMTHLWLSPPKEKNQ